MSRLRVKFGSICIGEVTYNYDIIIHTNGSKKSMSVSVMREERLLPSSTSPVKYDQCQRSVLIGTDIKF